MAACDSLRACCQHRVPWNDALGVAGAAGVSVVMIDPTAAVTDVGDRVTQDADGDASDPVASDVEYDELGGEGWDTDRDTSGLATWMARAAGGGAGVASAALAKKEPDSVASVSVCVHACYSVCVCVCLCVRMVDIDVDVYRRIAIDILRSLARSLSLARAGSTFSTRWAPER